MQTMLVKPEILSILNEEESKAIEEQKQVEIQIQIDENEALSTKLRKIWKIPTPMNKGNNMKKI